MKAYSGLFLFLICFCSSRLSAQVPGSNIDVQHYTFSIGLNDKNDSIAGNTSVKIKFLADAANFRLNLVKKNAKGKGMLVSMVTEEGKGPLKFLQDSDGVTINTTGKLNTVHTYQVIYSGIPADGLIISTNKFGHRTFFGDNWPNRGHNWLPCVDDPADKATVDFIVSAPAHYQVIANGLKTSESLVKGLKVTRYSESAPLSTKVMVIGVADFAIDHPGDVGKIPVYTYVFPENKDKGFQSYAVAKEILPFYIKKIGPFAYEKLANVQSKTIFGGMENASAIFYFENSVGDKGIEALMAHEIAHQWFGDAASEKSWPNLWLSEGFATYMTNLYLENKYGADTLKKRLDKDRLKIIAFEKRRFTPVVDTAVKSNYMQLLNANSYEKGGWALHMLRRKLGDELFWKGVSAYFAKYNGGNANTDDLRRAMEQVSGQSLQIFFKQWLFTAGHPRLKITWSYDQAKKAVTMQITQLQESLYNFSFEFGFDAEKQKPINVSERSTTIVISAAKKPFMIKPDPDVSLLADFTVTGSN